METVLSNQKNEFFCSGVFFVEFLPAFETVSSSIPDIPSVALPISSVFLTQSHGQLSHMPRPGFEPMQW